MKSLLIGHGQEFSLVKRAFIQNKSKIKIISEESPKRLVFKNKDKIEFNIEDILKGRLAAGDLKKIDSVFVSIYDREKLLPVLRQLSKLKLSQPVFIISTAVTDLYGEKFPKFHFLHIQDLFSKQIEARIMQCEFLFRVNRIKELIKPKDNVLIMIFENPDPDAIASAVALKVLFSKLKVKSTIAYTGNLTRHQNKVLIKELGKKIVNIDSLDIDKFTKKALVDAQPYFFEGKYDFDIVIDHHPRRVRINVPFYDVRTRIGSTSTILTQYLLNARIRINKKLATALLYGIKTDTNNLERHTFDEDIRTFRYLYSRADPNLLRKIELAEMPRQALPYFEYAIKNLNIYKESIYVNLGKTDVPEIQVMIADFLMKIVGISSVVVSAVHENNLIVIFRNNDYVEDAGKLAAAAFGKIGHAGGHKYMARAEISCENLKKTCKPFSKKAIDAYIKKQLAKAEI